MTNKPSPAVEKKSADKHKGMMGDGTEEQNFNQPGTPGARAMSPSSNMETGKSNATHEEQDGENDQDDTDDTHPTVTESSSCNCCL
jgi:hypothetical protein